MPSEIKVRLRPGAPALDVPATLNDSGPSAASVFDRLRGGGGVHLLLRGDRDYALTARPPVSPATLASLTASEKRSVLVVFPGRRPVRRLLDAISAPAAPPPPPAVTSPVDLTAGLSGAAPLWLLPEGTLAVRPEAAPTGMAARDALVTAARWVSSRRTSSFEQLFPPSAFHPELPTRTERLTAMQAEALLAQLRSALAEAKVGGDAAKGDALAAAEVRSAALTVLSHVLATALRDPSFRAAGDAAAAEIFSLIDAEQGDPTARSEIRAHAILLLQMRGPALSPEGRARAAECLQTLVRGAPPYAELSGPWNFAMCSDTAFHDGECDVLTSRHGFHPVAPPEGAPPPPRSFGASSYRVFEAPFRTPSGEPIRLFARPARPGDENLEMADPYFVGLLINRHAQLGSFDMRAAAVSVIQRGYKLMMNSQCAGLTTRFAVGRLFPDADIYSSWDSTYFRTDGSGRVNASEGLDCFVAILKGMSEGEPHAALGRRVQKAQWSHPQTSGRGDFVQFIGPSHPLVVARYSDVNQDGRADYYDGFLDLDLTGIAEDMQASITPRDPGVAASQVSGEAASGLGWAVGSMNRVTQYSDLWAGLAGDAELLYAFQSGGFFSQREPPTDIAAGKIAEDPARLPVVCRYAKQSDKGSDLDLGFSVEVLFHSWLSHSAQELKRLLVAADALFRAVDLGYLAATAELATPLGQRAMLLLTLAGLLEFPADQNFIDGLWSMALKVLRLPDISRSAVRGCITDADHEASNYYGSRRGLTQLIAALEAGDPVILAKLKDPDLTVGRAAPLSLP
jgi:hypothetical protein